MSCLSGHLSMSPVSKALMTYLRSGTACMENRWKYSCATIGFLSCLNCGAARTCCMAIPIKAAKNSGWKKN